MDVCDRAFVECTLNRKVFFCFAVYCTFIQFIRTVNLFVGSVPLGAVCFIIQFTLFATIVIHGLYYIYDLTSVMLTIVTATGLVSDLLIYFSKIISKDYTLVSSELAQFLRTVFLILNVVLLACMLTYTLIIETMAREFSRDYTIEVKYEDSIICASKWQVVQMTDNYAKVYNQWYYSLVLIGRMATYPIKSIIGCKEQNKDNKNAEVIVSRNY